MSQPKATIKPYHHPAAGWGALKQVAAQLALQKIPVKGVLTLLAQNQPDGFDCPGCAWPDKEHTSTFEFCENGVKAVAAEATNKRVPPEFFAKHTVTELMQWSDFDLENEGRLTHPMRYNPVTDKYEVVLWDDAFALMAEHLNALADPDEAVFYTSGRASNEAAFLYQLFVREFGTNNFPDCSNLCHESTSIALPATVGVGKGSVTLQDFEHADTLLIFGQNPATNHPRMLGELREAAKRGARIVAINPLKERGLERFADPQSPFDMLSFKGSQISSLFIQPKLGGDLALIKGMIKFVIQWDDVAIVKGTERVVDVDFIAQHTNNFEAIAADARQESWDVIVEESGVSLAQIEEIARIYATGDRVISTWGMGITQHKHGVATIKTLVNLMLLRGNVGKEGAGLCPVRGHSNVQGNRTVGIYEKMPLEFLQSLDRVFDLNVPKTPGYDAVASIEAMIDGKVKFFFGLGGNFSISTPDTDRTWQGMRNCELTAHVTTKLNRSHLVHGKEALILPCLGRTEIDTQETGPQGVTVEDSMSMVHISYGMNKPASPQLLSEPAIVARLAHATLKNSKTPWLEYIKDYSKIRDIIEQTMPVAFRDYNERIKTPGGFRMPVPSSQRIWNTPSGKAEFTLQAIPQNSPIHQAREQYGDQLFVLMTTRSHDQYNTTIYGMDDRYRGVFGQRRVIFMNPADIERQGLQAGDWINLVSVWQDGITRRADNFMVVSYDIPQGCLSGYYPETNNLVPLESVADHSRTPTSKSIPVIIEKASEVANAA
ncbi:FdhF/YdeP family oxidoreductase [Methylophilus sp. Leaf414]|jgi:molybdopterin-dependent oxidoreductase alpha subunit|uniref:FdhF/YdeP family oxidoreductase n=1 Tax=Methylophilus sp. Leaf414 TaxID=1736371 RepID=UPI0006FFCAD4|nr:FdhF/YdeP family oxidoreductase [Methylophilus sp. Leaf414]KQT37711.1 CbbBc protein [Methylophilus sp. Leaf414]